MRKKRNEKKKKQWTNKEYFIASCLVKWKRRGRKKEINSKRFSIGARGKNLQACKNVSRWMDDRGSENRKKTKMEKSIEWHFHYQNGNAFIARIQIN